MGAAVTAVGSTIAAGAETILTSAAEGSVLNKGLEFVGNIFDGGGEVKAPDVPESPMGETAPEPSFMDKAKSTLSNVWQNSTANIRDENGEIDGWKMAERAGTAAAAKGVQHALSDEGYTPAQVPDMSKPTLAQSYAPDAAAELQKLRNMG